jgi:hypothetical protein
MLSQPGFFLMYPSVPVIIMPANLYPAFVVMTIWRYPATYLNISTATAEILVVILIAKIQMAGTYVAAWQ